MIENALILAIREIRRNMMRAALTTLGIIIGVAAVIAMVTLGNGATASVTFQHQLARAQSADPLAGNAAHRRRAIGRQRF